MSRIDDIQKRACKMVGIAPEQYRLKQIGVRARSIVGSVMKKLGYYGKVEIVAESGVHHAPLSEQDRLAVEVIFNEVDQYRRARLKCP